MRTVSYTAGLLSIECFQICAQELWGLLSVIFNSMKCFVLHQKNYKKIMIHIAKKNSEILDIVQAFCMEKPLEQQTSQMLPNSISRPNFPQPQGTAVK